MLISFELVNRVCNCVQLNLIQFSSFRAGDDAFLKMRIHNKYNLNLKNRFCSTSYCTSHSQYFIVCMYIFTGLLLSEQIVTNHFSCFLIGFRLYLVRVSFWRYVCIDPKA